MLLEFRVSNFRSILAEQRLNLVANRDKTRADANCSPTGLVGVPMAIRSAAIYGPNASGKSNVVRALGFFQDVVKRSALGMTEGQAFDFEPFRFTPAGPELLTEMELTFVEEGVRYQYGFNLDRQRIHEEWLLVYKNRKPQRWFQRALDPSTNKEEYELSSHLAGERKLWQRSTRANALFLSTAVQLNSEQLRPIFQWIVERLTILTRTSPASTIELIESEAGKTAVLELLNEADLGIKNAHVRKLPIAEEILRRIEGLIPPELREGWRPESIRVELEHQALSTTGERISASLPLEEESLGTFRVFSLAAPILEALQAGKVLVIDEIDRSLHPLLTRHLVSKFHEHNFSGAQLIFTTHTTSLLDQDWLRRDQIFLVDKDPNLATRIYPLTDIRVRKNVPLEQIYLHGRLGATPVV